MSSQPKKKTKLSGYFPRQTRFNDEWVTDPIYKSWLKKVDEFNGRCSICYVNISVNNEGAAALKAHAITKRHLAETQKAVGCSLVSKFYTASHSGEELRATLVEMATVYHTISHQQSYSSGDCTVKLYCHLLKEDKIASKIHIGRTKASAIAENVLGPHSYDMLKRDIGENYFSISSDASNRGIF